MENKEMIEALHQISKEKGIDVEIIFEAIENSLELACKKSYGANADFAINMDRETGATTCYAKKIVVDEDEINDESFEITLTDARDISPHYELGDVVNIEFHPRDFGRIAALTAKQVIMQKIRDAEREILFNEYITKEHTVITGIVQRKDGKSKNVIVALGKMDAIMMPSDQIPTEKYQNQDRVKVFVSKVEMSTKGPMVNVSRTHPDLVRRLFEQEVPEIADGLVEIKGIAREAGARSKMSVRSNDPVIDPVGACVGQGGSRVNMIVHELGGEKIDIITYSDDPKDYIISALNPSKVLDVTIEADEEGTATARVIVPKDQLSLAIGASGQNARLAAKLTGYRIDIKGDDTSNYSDAYQDYYGNDGDEYYDDEHYDEAYDGEYSEEAYDDNSDLGDYSESDEYYEGEA